MKGLPRSSRDRSPSRWCHIRMPPENHALDQAALAAAMHMEGGTGTHELQHGLT